ncbi:prepilin-type N-terminal cleavage/methylation domain-containing protein [Photobacterium aphoticum]|uniref:Type IV fimbrial biogenesis protein PilV n=1 Tax=Photobacterium aphoticum TaxID=754436 RepID=A0A0J1GKZ4_9GAMM|nr:prepilin-type N-terminal cleavage/methylation domain-containing protein [Photobacterium aphoticum]KLV00430.1 hypothetical protein ABT58_12240 [Photobacterium aphoticum]PSU59772.1 prepilin-type cleavage/methylation domain-containing protein [Photobacterium aphoticum]GHA42467.1 hypothetical protein GCM10007086_15090 [Photobacterium aphoticum]
MTLQHPSQRGFSLIEALVALFISSVALLALAAGQLKSLQYANNSFQYTLAMIQANNAVERVWNDACALQHGVKEFDQPYIDTTLSPDLPGYTLTLVGVEAHAFTNNFTVNVAWDDTRVNDEARSENQINVNVTFPKLPSRCHAI